MASAPSTTDRRPYWAIQLDSPPKRNLNAPRPRDPPGYTASSGSKRQASKPSLARKTPTTAETDTLKIKKSWELAIAPAKQLPMNAIMMYMSGNSLQIFSIMMVFMLFKGPIMGLVQTNQVFTRFETEGTRKTLWMVKLVYVAMQLAALAMGVWKVNGMGLLP
ncbi:MAG: hypothetical protein Q9195_007033 [Heterodermia aff. obscurata]